MAALILAKGESRRLPRKNKLDFNGKPMFLWNVEKCLKIFDKVYVSSDDPEILFQAWNAGAVGIERGPELCGETPNIPVYQHALKHMGDVDAIVAVQANSPTVEPHLIEMTKSLLDMGVQEVMTCHKDRSIYGSIWAMTKGRLENYGDPYDPQPDVLFLDPSIDIHNEDDLAKALCQ